jgi:AcrR family transcriptional regulator
MSKSATVRTRDPERTRQKLLDAAMTEFATHGLTGAKVERIARRAGVNKRLVYHYFKSKERLYREVLERAYLLIHTREDEINLDTRRPEEALADLIDRTFERIIALPHVNALIVDQNLHRAKHIKNAAWVQDMHGRLIEQIQAMLDAGCKAGVFRPNVDPVRLFISVLALCLTYVTNRYTLSVVFSRDLFSPSAREAWKRHVLDICLNGLRPLEKATLR